MKNILRKVKKLRLGNLINILYWIFVGFVLTLGIIVTLSVLNIGGIGIYNVMSGSMSPRILAGSLAVILPKSSYTEGEVITYQVENPSTSVKSTITHRIIKTNNKEGQELFITKGDRNPSEDSSPVKKDQILGKAVVTIPFIGYIASFARTLVGFLIIVVIPGFLIIFSEIFKIATNFHNLKRKEAI